MNFLTTMALAASIIGTSLADTPVMEDNTLAYQENTLAYHQVTRPPMAYTSLPGSISKRMPIQPIEAIMAPTVTAVIPVPLSSGDQSTLKGTASILGTIGMVILLFRRRADIA